MENVPSTNEVSISVEQVTTKDADIHVDEDESLIKQRGRPQKVPKGL